MASSPGSNPRIQLGKVLRERFLAEAGKAMVEISAAVEAKLTELMDELTNARESQIRRDVWTAYKRARPVWVDLTMKEWRACLEPAKSKPAAKAPDMGGLELVGTEVVENKILASRLVLSVNEKVHAELDDLRVRIKLLESLEDLDGRDLLRPEVLILLMVEQWAKCGMPGDAWPMVNDVVQRGLIVRLREAYQNANRLLIEKGVLPTIEVKDRVRAPRVISPANPAPAGRAPVGDRPKNPQESLSAQARSGAIAPGGDGLSGNPGNSEQPAQQGGGFFGGRLGWGSGNGAHSAASAPPRVSESQLLTSPHQTASTPFWRQSGGSQSGSSPGYASGDEYGAAANNTPLARARSRAQGVIGQIRRIFVTSAEPNYGVGRGEGGGSVQQPSPALANAMAQGAAAARYAAGGTLYEDYSPAGVARVAGELRQKSGDLKKKAETRGEKATIEIVALMFQAILAEDRIPPGIRVWFARLQMPVLRVALEDADFLGTTEHPARLLIDRLGSCVMGFDATGVQGAAMEAEVRRIVQVIEQYPETGKKVYQIVYSEFQKFLSKFLTEKDSTQKVVSVAQQVEQKETLAIQYTIEMRNMLKDMPVRDEVRDFLFKVWAEVLAVSALRKGAKHADTQTLKKCVTDLLWAAGAKPNRVDRARVIQELPNLLLRLRSGMTLLAMPPSEQEANVKKISDTLADAFLSKTQAIPQAKIDAMAQRLGNLEDFVSEDGVGDLPLDAESLEMMLGIDASAIEVVVNGGSKPTAAMLAWAGELQLGSWFTLDHNNQITQVQFAWRSEKKHLNLFASTSGKTYLIQAGRLAAYLQAGLLLPQEDEALTVRATRDALAKIEANPERLLT